MDVLKFSNETKQTADELLKYGNVLETLAKYGNPVVTGSYKYDLMYGPDIDIIVLSDNPQETSFGALKDFIGQRNFRKYQLGDFVKFPIDGRPQGFIVVLILEFQGRKWEIEIWFKTYLTEDDKYFDKLLSTISPEFRKIILEIKNQRENAGLLKNKLRTATIYEGVVLEGKKDIKDFSL